MPDDPIPLSIIEAISARSGTENPQVGMLQLATVRPHPHWHVRPCATSSTVVDENPGAGKNNASPNNATSTRMPAERLIEISLAPRCGLDRDRFFATAERLGDRGTLAHVGPHCDDGAENHDQTASP